MFDLHLESNKLRKLLSIAGIALFLGLVFNYFFFAKLPGISFPIFVALILGGLALLGRVFSIHIPRTTWLLGLAALFFASMVFVRASMPLTDLNILTCLVLLLLITVSVLGKHLQQYLIIDYAKIALVPFKILGRAFTTIAEMITLRTAPKDTSRMPQILMGIGLAIPVLVLFIILFSSADLVFAKFLKNLVDIHISPETLGRTILVLAVTFIFIGAYAFTLRHRGHDQETRDEGQLSSLGLLTSSILLGSVNALFLVFVVIQLAYLFGGEANITGQGFTYAEYARKGFFELLLVAMVSLVLLLTTEKYTAKKDSRHTGTFKVMSGVLVLQVFLIIISAFRRLVLYEQAYGFTVLRLFSHVFTVWLGIIFLFLLYKIFVQNSERTFMWYGFLSAIVVLAFLNLANPEAFIAKQNMKRYETTGKLDTQYLGSLSEDAVGETIQGLTLKNPLLKGALAHRLYSDLSTKYDSSLFSSWPSANLSRSRGMKILEAHRSELEQYKDFQEEVPE